MKSQSLNGAWQFHQAGQPEWLPGQVPGGVHTDLLRLGRIPDPFVADHELDVLWVAESDWEYRLGFEVDEEVLEENEVFLVCDGLDTLADVRLNGAFLGSADNMFRGWEWAVKPLLREGENELVIYFSGPARVASERQKKLHLANAGGALPGGPHLRKAPCHFGWDWGPQLPPIGIWKDIRLEGRTHARIQNVHLRQALDAAQGRITARVEVAALGGQDLGFSKCKALMTVTAPDGEITQVDVNLIRFNPSDPYFANLEVVIPDPQLWWPNEYGTQPLYQVEIRLMMQENLLEQRTYQVGLRTLELRQEPDEWGKSFTFFVNGVPVFAKGADWIPADSFPTRLTAAFLENLISSAAQAHMNMLRIWGGGYYPEEMFYDLCDRYGILVWQDFMFACASYPADPGFFENVRIEAIENIRRLRHRASLALWCGNNEMEQGWCDWGWARNPDPLTQRLKDGYDRMFHHMLPEVVAAEDPDHAYWPSSASSGVPFENPNGQEQGDCHYWDVWHGRKPFTAYRSQYPRFMSEFGFQALPPLKTIATYAEKQDWNMTSYIMEHHQRSWVGNGLMVAQMTDTFRMPKDFPSLVYLSLVLQGEGIRYGVEHWRRNRERVSGTLIWQLNDCWPVASWSSLDYFGRWKALHYLARRFYAPLLLSVEDTGKTMSVHLTSDLVQPWDGSVRWRLETLDGKALKSGEAAVHAAPLRDTQVGVYAFDSMGYALVDTSNQRSVVFVCELWDGDTLLSRCVTPFTASKHLELRQPKLSAQVSLQGDELAIQVGARSLARFVELELDEADVVFSDNYFDLPAGQTVQVTCPLPDGWTLEQAQKALKIRSLFDSY